jgi:hypothetical protein
LNALRRAGGWLNRNALPAVVLAFLTTAVTVPTTVLLTRAVAPSGGVQTVTLQGETAKQLYILATDARDRFDRAVEFLSRIEGNLPIPPPVARAYRRALRARPGIDRLYDAGRYADAYTRYNKALQEFRRVCTTRYIACLVFGP